MNNLNDIVNITVDIAAPVVGSESFDNLLIFGPAPVAVTAVPPPAVGVYSSLDQVTAAGWVAVGGNADPVGAAASVAFSQSPRPTRIYIAVQQKLVSGTLEDPTATIARAIPVSGWYVACPAGIDESKYEDIATYVETQSKMFAFPVFDNLQVVANVYFRSFGIYAKQNMDQLATDVPQANNYIHVAFCAKCLGYRSGSETWAFKTLAGIYPSEITGTQISELSAVNISFYGTYSARNITQGGKVMAGEWIDIIRFRDWLQNDMQLRIFNLFAVNPKIPYTNYGINLVENQMIASLKAGTLAGGIAPDEYDSDGNTVPGYVVSVPNAAGLSAAQRAARILTDCKFFARLSGAIHLINVYGTLSYEQIGVEVNG